MQILVLERWTESVEALAARVNGHELTARRREARRRGATTAASVEVKWERRAAYVDCEHQEEHVVTLFASLSDIQVEKALLRSHALTSDKSHSVTPVADAFAQNPSAWDIIKKMWVAVLAWLHAVLPWPALSSSGSFCIYLSVVGRYAKDFCGLNYGTDLETTDSHVPTLASLDPRLINDRLSECRPSHRYRRLEKLKPPENDEGDSPQILPAHRG